MYKFNVTIIGTYTKKKKYLRISLFLKVIKRLYPKSNQKINTNTPYIYI